MRQTINTTATYKMKAYVSADEINVTENDIVLGVDSAGNTWVLIKQTKGRGF